jgi:hypothetical protein
LGASPINRKARSAFSGRPASGKRAEQIDLRIGDGGVLRRQCGFGRTRNEQGAVEGGQRGLGIRLRCRDPGADRLLVQEIPADEQPAERPGTEQIADTGPGGPDRAAARDARIEVAVLAPIRAVSAARRRSAAGDQGRAVTNRDRLGDFQPDAAHRRDSGQR